MGLHADHSVMRDSKPESLTSKELELATEPVTRTPVPTPVTAWVRYGKIGIKIEGRMVAWTSRAAAVEWETPQGPHRAWVWASAIERK